MKQIELDVILDKHQEGGGECVDLSGTNLHGTDLSYADWMIGIMFTLGVLVGSLIGYMFTMDWLL